mgnify:CR=1 FL=1
MKLSNQSITAIMMALQNSLMEQSDIVPVLKNFNLIRSEGTSRWGAKGGEIDIDNPPVVVVKNPEEPTKTSKFDLE